MEEIKKTLKSLQQAYIFFWLVPIVIVLLRELSEDGNGHQAGNVPLTYTLETITILLTVACVPLALKMFAGKIRQKTDHLPLVAALAQYKRWSIIRLVMLFVPVYAGIATYYLTLSTTGALCAAIGLTASLFCVPTEQRLKTDLRIEG